MQMVIFFKRNSRNSTETSIESKQYHPHTTIKLWLGGSMHQVHKVVNQEML